MWKIYLLIVDEGMRVPELQLSRPAFEKPAWGSWIDLDAMVPPKAVISAPQKPQTRPIDIEIRLIGVVGFGAGGVAIMRVRGGNETVYTQGELVADDIFLAKIMLKGILLSNGESERTFLFPQVYGLLKSPGEDLNSLPQDSPISRVSPPVQPPLPDIEALPGIPSNRQLSPRVKRELARLKEQPLAITRQADIELVRRGGEIYGVRIGSLRNPELFHAVGLNSSDIVLSVNGQSVPSLAANPVQAQQLLQGSNFSIEILRNGRHQIINFNLP